MPNALAIFAHPDDIEFSAAGTLLLLRQAGWKIHYLNVSSGNLGSMTLPPNEVREVRREEAQRAAEILGATWHPPLAEDLEIVYQVELLRQLAAIVRRVNPGIILTHSPVDYMEDHIATARLAVTAAFARGMPNFVTDPHVKHVEGEATLYHAQPHMNRDPLGAVITPGIYVDVSSVMDTKRDALAAHESQKTWLDRTQGMNSYLKTMEDLTREVGSMSGRFQFAEGWRKHLHAGFCRADADPLSEALVNHAFVRA
ncbi:MAG TPA: LmbE family protein [Verrucomicrobiales bacterium]|nr:LmbE family protein [Verrucomicrobiales bacterium]